MNKWCKLCFNIWSKSIWYSQLNTGAYGSYYMNPAAYNAFVPCWFHVVLGWGDLHKHKVSGDKYDLFPVFCLPGFALGCSSGDVRTYTQACVHGNIYDCCYSSELLIWHTPRVEKHILPIKYSHDLSQGVYIYALFCSRFLLSRNYRRKSQPCLFTNWVVKVIQIYF